MPGLIPASAGSTRGEITGTHTFEGSSPRLRGAPVDTTSVCLVGGLIPASAGSTPAFLDVPLGAAAHPRVCGEHEAGRRPGHDQTGSSPRLRGALFPFAMWSREFRLIPASAGSTVSSARSAPRMRAHPRVCGEHSVLNRFT